MGIDRNDLLKGIFLFVLTGLMLAFLIAIFVQLKLKYWHKMHPTVRKGFEAMRSKLMYSSILRAILQSYYSTAINTLYAIKAGNTNGAQNLVTAILTLLGLIAFMVFSYFFMHRHKDDIAKKGFKASFGTLYQNVEIYNQPAGLNFTVLFCARRLAFAFAIVFLDQILTNQIYVSVFTTLGMASWHIAYLPMMDILNNFVYIFNELVLLFLAYYIFLFSGYVPTLE